MGVVKYSTDVAVPADEAFCYTENPVHVPDWLFGVTRFRPAGSVDVGVGAVFETAVRLGPLRFETEFEVTEYQRDTVIGLTVSDRARTSIAQRLLPGAGLIRNEIYPRHFVFRFSELGCGRSVLTVEIDYRTARRRVEALATRVAVSFRNDTVRHTAGRLRKQMQQYYGVDLAGRIT